MLSLRCVLGATLLAQAAEAFMGGAPPALRPIGGTGIVGRKEGNVAGRSLLMPRWTRTELYTQTLADRQDRKTYPSNHHQTLPALNRTPCNLQSLESRPLIRCPCPQDVRLIAADHGRGRWLPAVIPACGDFRDRGQGLHRHGQAPSPQGGHGSPRRFGVPDRDELCRQ